MLPRVTGETASGAVSIVIRVWNEERNLPGCLLSALFTSAREVVVCDDGSTDGSADVVRSTMLRFDRLRLVQGNVTPESEWVLYLDPRARISSRALERLLAEAEASRLDRLTCTAPEDLVTFRQKLLVPAREFITPAGTTTACELVRRAGGRTGHFYGTGIVTLNGNSATVAPLYLVAHLALQCWWPTLLLSILARLALAYRNSQPWWSALLHPIALVYLVWTTAIDKVRGRT